MAPLITIPENKFLGWKKCLKLKCFKIVVLSFLNSLKREPAAWNLSEKKEVKWLSSQRELYRKKVEAKAFPQKIKEKNRKGKKSSVKCGKNQRQRRNFGKEEEYLIRFKVGYKKKTFIFFRIWTTRWKYFPRLHVTSEIILWMSKLHEHMSRNICLDDF